MRRVLLILTIAALTAGTFAVLAVPAGAQTGGDLTAFCAARIEANGAEGKAANLAIMNKMVPIAPEGVVAAMTALRDAYEKKGDKLFNGPEGPALLAPVDSWVYDNCPGTQVAVTAIDYEYEGMPATLKAGLTNFKMTNGAPKEEHMLGITKLTPAAEGKDVADLLALPEKKQAKYFDESSGAFMIAPAGETAYSPADLTPGTYAYACFLPVGGKRNGAPHFTKGMYGTFTVQ